MLEWPKYVKNNKTEKPCDCLEACIDIVYHMETLSDTDMNIYVKKNLKGFIMAAFYDHSAEVRESILTYNLPNFM